MVLKLLMKNITKIFILFTIEHFLVSKYIFLSEYFFYGHVLLFTNFMKSLGMYFSYMYFFPNLI